MSVPVTSIILGDDNDGKAVRLDLPILVKSRMVVQANSGSGKSFFLRRLLEQTHGKVQHLVLDIEGEFASLREKFDYVLAARVGGDTLADTRTAPLLARRLLELNVSAILDLSELKADERIVFVRLFLESLVSAPRALWHPALVVVDEAHLFCPEGSKAESAAAVIDLMTRGRKRGFCGVLATQRLAKLAKNAAAEANVKLIGRASMDVDMQRAGEELQWPKAEWARLRQLKPGTFYGFGPGLSDLPVEVAIGPVETSHPEAGTQAVTVPAPRAKVLKILDQLKDLPKEAEQEAKTVAELRSELQRLKREVAAGPAPAAPAPPVKVPVFTEEHIQRIEGSVRVLEAATKTFISGMQESAEDLCREQELVKTQVQLLHGLVANAADGFRKGGADAAEITRRQNRLVTGGAGRLVGANPAPPGRERSAPPLNGNGIERAAERKILTVLANYPQGRTVRQVAILAGYAMGGGGFRNAVGRMRTLGYIEGGSSLLRITDAGLDALGPVEALPTGTALRLHWLGTLDRAAERKILEVVTGAYPESLTTEEIASRAGYEAGGGGFRNALGKLRTLELIAGRGDVRAAAELFD